MVTFRKKVLILLGLILLGVLFPYRPLSQWLKTEVIELAPSRYTENTGYVIRSVVDLKRFSSIQKEASITFPFQILKGQLYHIYGKVCKNKGYGNLSLYYDENILIGTFSLLNNTPKNESGDCDFMKLGEVKLGNGSHKIMARTHSLEKVEFERLYLFDSDVPVHKVESKITAPRASIFLILHKLNIFAILFLLCQLLLGLLGQYRILFRPAEQKIVTLLFILSALAYYPFIIYDFKATPIEAVALYKPWSNYLPTRVKNIDSTRSLNKEYAKYLYLKDSLRQKEVPLWNPHILCGTPFLADMTQGVFYPFHLIFLFTEVDEGLTWLSFLHLFLGCLGLYLLGRLFKISMVSAFWIALGFMAFGHMTVNRDHTATFFAICLMPYVFLFLEVLVQKRTVSAAILLGLTLSFLTLNGQVLLLFFTGIILVFYFLVRLFQKHGQVKNLHLTLKLMLLFFFAVLLSLLISAVTLVPFFQFQNQVHLNSHPLSAVLNSSLSYYHILLFFNPLAFGSPVHFNYFGNGSYGDYALYMGVLPFLLALYSFFLFNYRPVKALIICLGFIVLIAAGTPFVWVLHVLFTPLKHFGSISPMGILLVFFLLLLSGFGLDYFIGQVQKKNQSFINIHKYLALICAGFIGAMILLITIGNIILSRVQQKDSMLFSIISTEVVGIRGVVIVLMVSLSALVLFIYRLLPSRWFAILVIAITYLELSIFSANFRPFTDSRLTQLNQIDILEFLKEKTRQDPPFRIHRYPIQDPITPANYTPYQYRLSEVSGTADYILKSYFDLIDRLNLLTSTAAGLNLPFLNLFDIGYVITDKTISTPRFEPILFKEGMVLLKNKTERQRISIVHDHAVWIDKAKMLEQMTLADFAPERTVFLSERPEKIYGESAGTDIEADRVEIVHYGNHRVELKVALKEKGFLVLKDNYYPSWKAYVDGQPAYIYKAFSAFRALYLNKGNHRILFEYDKRAFYLGALISFLAIGLIGLYFLLIGIWWRRRG